MFITISLLLAAVCLLPATGKLLGHPKMRQSAAHFGVPGPVTGSSEPPNWPPPRAFWSAWSGIPSVWPRPPGSCCSSAR